MAFLLTFHFSNSLKGSSPAFMYRWCSIVTPLFLCLSQASFFDESRFASRDFSWTTNWWSQFAYKASTLSNMNQVLFSFVRYPYDFSFHIFVSFFDVHRTPSHLESHEELPAPCLLLSLNTFLQASKWCKRGRSKNAIFMFTREEEKENENLTHRSQTPSHGQRRCFTVFRYLDRYQDMSTRYVRNFLCFCLVCG